MSNTRLLEVPARVDELEKALILLKQRVDKLDLEMPRNNSLEVPKDAN